MTSTSFLAILSLAVPALLTAGELFPHAPRFRWPYCVMSTLAGRPLDERPITAADRHRIGAFLGKLWGKPISVNSIRRGEAGEVPRPVTNRQPQ